MTKPSKDSFNTQSTLTVDGKEYYYYSLKEFAKSAKQDINKLPVTLKVLLENNLRYEDEQVVTADDIHAISDWLIEKTSKTEIAYHPARVLMQDFTGVPAVVDLAAMRDAMSEMGGDPKRINPLSAVDLVIDHSVQVDKFGSNAAFSSNVEFEMKRNHERYEFLKWGQKAFKNFGVIPPGTGICHQVNLEFLAKVAWQKEIEGKNYVFPDTLVGTDSHTTMINGIGVLGWGVGGIEAEAAMLGQPVSMLIPEVIGFKLKGKLGEGITATDLVLTVTQMLRARGVVGKFVEFFGPGLADLPLENRATVANMAPEYGATCGFFPVDEHTMRYMKLSGRDDHTLALVEAYTKAQGLWRDANSPDPVFTDTLELDLGTVEASLAGPKRPQDKVTLSTLPKAFESVLQETNKVAEADKAISVNNGAYELKHGAVVIAAITSCTNTSNPSVLMAAGLLAKKALEKGLRVKPWVKTSFAPGSKVVTEYLETTGLQTYLDDLGFNLVGYGCTTCIGNSGPLPEEVSAAIVEGDLQVSSVLSGNRNFEGRIHQHVKANWLASPPLVVAFALAGTTRVDLSSEPLGLDHDGKPVMLKDIWPSNAEVAEQVAQVNQNMFREQYSNVFDGDESWRDIKVEASNTYAWDPASTYVRKPTFFDGLSPDVAPPSDIVDANIIALLGDSVTTDHISPAGNIAVDSPAGHYLKGHGIDKADFNSYGSRRGNHEVMMRGTFANIRIRNEMAPGTEGGVTKHIPTGDILPIYDAAMRYQESRTPLVVIAGKEYGTGSSRDWAAKGTLLLGIKAVITEGFERIHRSNLIGMGVLPLQFAKGVSRQSLGLDGSEKVSITGLSSGVAPGKHYPVTFTKQNGEQVQTEVLCRIDTENEAQYYLNGGILHYVLRKLVK